VFRTRRLLLLSFAVFAAVLVPLAAVGAANDWWFLKTGAAPVPTTAPQVVMEEEWNGRPWQLVAYPSATHGLCISMTPKDSAARGEGGAMACGPFVGIARTPESKASPDITGSFRPRWSRLSTAGSLRSAAGLASLIA
jgi:hypothetical protein